MDYLLDANDKENRDNEIRQNDNSRENVQNNSKQNLHDSNTERNKRVLELIDKILNGSRMTSRMRETRLDDFIGDGTFNVNFDRNHANSQLIRVINPGQSDAKAMVYGPRRKNGNNNQ